ncbi:Uncharacterised protein [Escherichia coli]|uniref:Uncharacterized protein n=1 Tax=Escherichia coli TaxID=562 RepID=A0A376U6E7_ECOLX|nr:Uncharacterised protein [Escherichia coli]
MDLTQCPSLASLLTHGQQITTVSINAAGLKPRTGGSSSLKRQMFNLLKTAVYRLCRARVISAAGFPA